MCIRDRTITIQGRFDFGAHQEFRRAYERVDIRPKRYTVNSCPSSEGSEVMGMKHSLISGITRSPLRRVNVASLLCRAADKLLTRVVTRCLTCFSWPCPARAQAMLNSYLRRFSTSLPKQQLHSRESRRGMRCDNSSSSFCSRLSSARRASSR